MALIELARYLPRHELHRSNRYLRGAARQREDGEAPVGKS
jgi:hypothetical protein